MKILPQEVRRKRRTAIDAALLFILILLITQMWLLTATLELYLAGHKEAALPGFITSAVLFAACFAIYRFVVRLDRAPERQQETSGAGPWDIQ
jgi:hypothetical protein